MKKVTLQHEMREVPSRKVIYVSSIGPYDGQGTHRAWEKVCRFAGQNNLFASNTVFIGISYDDPNITDSKKLRYDACVSIDENVKPEGEVGIREIADGKYMVFLHEGPYENFQYSYDYIFGEWLSESKMELREEPSFELYLNSPDETNPEDLKTEIWVPVK